MCGLGLDQKQFKSTAACASPVVKRLEFLPSPVPPEETASSEKDVKKAEIEQQKGAELPPTQEVCIGRNKREWKTSKKKKKEGERSYTEMFIVQIGIFLHKMSLQELVQNMILKDGFRCQILWSSGSSPSKGTPQCLLVVFEPVNW